MQFFSFLFQFFFLEKYRASIPPGCFVGYIREEFSVSFITLWPNSGAVPRDYFQWMFITQAYTYDFLLQWSIVLQAPVVQTFDSAIHRIKINPVGNALGSLNAYLLDRDLSGG